MKAAAGDGKIGVGLAAMLVAGNMIGSGVYLLPAVLAGVGGISLLGWGVAVLGALVLACMFAAFANYGLEASGDQGLIGRIADGLGPFWGYQAAALYSVGCWVGNVAIALAVTGYAASFAPLLSNGVGSAVFTIVLILLVTAFNIFGSRMVGRLQAATLAIGLAPVLLIGVAGWAAFHSAMFAAQWNVTGRSAAHAVGDTILPIFWAFLGLESAAVCAVRVRDPGRNIARATVIGVALAGIIYAASCVVLLGILPAKALAASTAPFADGAHAILGLGFGAVVAVCAMTRATGTLTGWVLVTAETAQSAAASGLFSRVLARPGPQATVRTLLVAAVIMSAIVIVSAAPALSQQFAALIDAAVLVSLAMYMLSAAALWRLSRDEPDRRRRLFVRSVAGLSILFCLGVVLTTKPALLALGFAVAALAALAYLFARVRRVEPA
jgi:arginine:agmatine antiporter